MYLLNVMEQSGLSAQEKLYDWIDTFHNVQPERHPSRIGPSPF